ncbi:MAG: endonuclease/exonuclease/phosphatase family protein [Planctomycetota bacterium]
MKLTGRQVARIVSVPATLLGVLLGLFAWTGLETSWREGEHQVLEGVPTATGERQSLRVFTLNLAKAGFHAGGVEFRPIEEVEARLERVAVAIEGLEPDLVFLNEVVHECAVEPQAQARWLAERCGFAHVATGDNYRFGIDRFVIRSGNAILSRFPLDAIEVQPLAGAAAFWNPTNTRRALWAEATIGARRVRLASIRNDSFDLANNAAQATQLVERLDDRPVLLAGDFNAEVSDPAFEVYRAAGLDAGADASATYPAGAPRRRIDFIASGPGWTRLDGRVVDTKASDHLGVFAVLALP